MKITISSFAHAQFAGVHAPLAGIDPIECQTELNRRSPDLDLPGYAPFCRLLFYRNWTSAKSGIVSLAPDLLPHVETAYEARRDRELPVLVRYVSSKYCSERAKFLCLILYDRKQMALEGEPIQADYAIVHVLCLREPSEPPLPPITQMRNALGVAEGGSGVSLDRDQYLAAVEFWDKHIAVRPE